MARILFLGDVHRSFDELETLIANATDVHGIIQVGDLGVRPREGLPPGSRDLSPCRPLHYVDGNWDHFAWLEEDGDAPKEVLPNVIHVPRGLVLPMAGLRVGFLGGAKSVSPYRRTPGINWWPTREPVQPHQVNRLIEAGPVDLLVTHTPPAEVIDHVFADPRPPAPIGFAPASIHDAMVLADLRGEQRPKHDSAVQVQRAWDRLGRPPIVSGHLHRSYHSPGIHVLDQMETLTLEIQPRDGSAR